MKAILILILIIWGIIIIGLFMGLTEISYSGALILTIKQPIATILYYSIASVVISISIEKGK